MIVFIFMKSPSKGNLGSVSHSQDDPKQADSGGHVFDGRSYSKSS